MTRVPIALLKAFPGALAQKRHHGLAFWDRVFGKFVTKIVQSELKPGRKFNSISNRLRQIRKECSHFLRGFEIPLRVARQQPSCGGERLVMAESSKDIA